MLGQVQVESKELPTKECRNARYVAMAGETFPAMLCSTRSHFVARLIFQPRANGRGLCCKRQTPPDFVRRGRVKKTPYHAWPTLHRHNLPLLPHPCILITMLKVKYFSKKQGCFYIHSWLVAARYNANPVTARPKHVTDMCGGALLGPH